MFLALEVEDEIYNWAGYMKNYMYVLNQVT